MARDGEASQGWPAVKRRRLPAADRAARILTGERLQDLHRVGRRCGLHARVRRGRLWRPEGTSDRLERQTALRCGGRPGFAFETLRTQHFQRSGNEALEHRPAYWPEAPVGVWQFRWRPCHDALREIRTWPAACYCPATAAPGRGGAAARRVAVMRRARGGRG